MCNCMASINYFSATLFTVIFFLITAPGWLELLLRHPNPVMFMTELSTEH